MAKRLEWKTERRKVSELIPYEGNPRQLTKVQARQLEKSLKKFNLVEIPAINTDNKVIAGHQRLVIMMLLGRRDEVIDVRVPNRKLTEAEFREYNLRSNKNTGEWDWDMLANNFDLDLLKEVGFSTEELSGKLMPKIDEDDFDAGEEYEKITEAKAKRGEIYKLGNHRLMCGDSTSREDVTALMGGGKADMIFTDPPYGVNYTQDKYKGIRKERKVPFADAGKILGDNKTEAELYEFLKKAFELMNEFSHDHAPIYVCHATKTQIAFHTAFRDAGYLFSQTIIWLKERIILALGQDYHRVYEPIMFGWKQGSKHFANRTITTDKEVWDLDKMTFEERLDLWYLIRDKSKNYIHPTQKPIRLAERALKKSSKIGDLLYEPFNGSGSTMMACEKTGRKCYACELDPKYVDVSIDRWQRSTGQKAMLVRTADGTDLRKGLAFDAIKPSTQ